MTKRKIDTETIFYRNWNKRLTRLNLYDIDLDRKYLVSQYAEMMDCRPATIYNLVKMERVWSRFYKRDFVRMIKTKLKERRTA